MSYINNRTLRDRGWNQSRRVTAVVMEREMMNFTAGQVESITGGILAGGSRGLLASGVSIDTRTLEPGALFFAIRGPHNDGHDFVASALEKGASGAVVDMRYRVPADIPPDRILLRVADTHQALKDLAADARRRWRGTLIGITGSMGKTTTKEFAAQILQTEFSVYRSPGNLNNLFGLPLALFGLRAEDHIGIFEMGMSARGEIAEMCRIALPELGIITNIAPVHLEFFESLAEIARAKEELAEALPESGALFFNADDPLVADIASRFGGCKTSFGFSERADIRASAIEIAGLQETRFRITHAGSVYRAMIPLAGGHFVRNALPAVALGIHYRLPMEQIVEALRHLHGAKMRGQTLHFREGFTVIDDSYNSSPRALMQMTETLCRVPSYTRRVLVAGEMLELGRDSAALHRECGAWAAACGVDLVIGIRGDAREITGAAEAAGLSGRAWFFDDVEAAARFVSQSVQVGDLVLIKGSRGVHLEKIVQMLRAQHAEQGN